MIIVFFKVFQVITRKNPESVLCVEKINIGTEWTVRKKDRAHNTNMLKF